MGKPKQGETDERGRPAGVDRVAVIVVHGLADQTLGETVRAVTATVSDETWPPLSEKTRYLQTADQSFPVPTFECEGADAAAKRPRLSVAFHELYWADLSRPGKSLLGMLGSFWRVVSTLPDHARAELSDN